MNKIITAIIFSIFISSLAGCTTNYSSATQVEDSGYILLKGNFSNTVLHIDDTSTTIDETIARFKLNGYLVSKFPVSVGAHSVKVERNGITLINKKVLLSNAQTVELIIP